MEEIKAYKCRSFHRRYNEAFAICFGVYDKRDSDKVCQGKAKRGSDRPGEPPPPGTIA